MGIVDLGYDLTMRGPNVTHSGRKLNVLFHASRIAAVKMPTLQSATETQSTEKNLVEPTISAVKRDNRRIYE